MNTYNDEFFTELAALWLAEGSVVRVLELAGGGKNNTTRIIEASGDGGAGKARYVLRVYETHRDEARLAYEHAVLLALAALPQQVHGTSVAVPAEAAEALAEAAAEAPVDELAETLAVTAPPAFAALQRTPTPASALHTPVPQRLPDGATFARVPAGASAGKLAALFSYTEGENPALDSAAQLESFGRAVGLLTEALQRVQLPLEPAYRPYYELEHTHPLCPPHRVAAFCQAPPAALRPLQSELLAIREQLSLIGESLPRLQRLPHALVHGDLNASNVLADSDGAIVAILDFEFVTRDLRAMELAVCLSDILDPDGGSAPASGSSDGDGSPLWMRAEALLRGYGPRLTTDEADALPLLVLLRRLDVFIHFLGRYWDGVDSEEMVREQILSASRHITWLNLHGSRFLELCRRQLKGGER